MERVVAFAVNRPRTTLAVTAVLTVLLATGAFRLELRTDGAALEPRGDPVVERSAHDRERFRDPRALLLVVESADGSSLASPAGFEFLRGLDAALQRLDVLQADEILSLATLPRVVRAGRGGLAIDSYLDRIPDDPARFGALLAEVRSRALTDGLMLSADGTRALVYLPLSDEVSTVAAVGELERFAAGAATPEFELLLGGPLVAETTLGEWVLRDLAVLVPLMGVAIVALLAALLRSPGGVVIPIVEAGVVLAWTFGAMGWSDAPIALVTTILPVVLMAMCITDEIHLLERLEAYRDEADMRLRVRRALRDVGRPIVATSLTTALGFLSFLSTSVVPLREFGVFAAFGILVAMALSFSFIPALIVFLPERAFVVRGTRDFAGDSLRAYGRLAARRPGLCLALGLGALACVLPGLPELRVSDSWVENFSPDSGVVRAERALNESFWGSYRFDVVFEGEPGLFRDPAGAAVLERASAIATGAPHVGGVVTLLTPLEEIAAELGVAPPLSGRSEVELWDLFTLAEMSPHSAGLGPLLSGRGGTARVRLYVRSPDYHHARELTDYLAEALGPIASEAGVAYHFSGELPVASAMVESIVSNQLHSIGWALVTVAAVLWLLSRRLSALWALVPVLSATAGLLGFMGLAGIPLGIATSMFASLTVGVGVDFGIHFVHRYERVLADAENATAAIRATIDQAGKALLWNAATLATGFFVLTASSLKPNHSLGLLLAAATLSCFAGSFLLLPWLLQRTARPLAATAVLALLLASPAANAREPECDGAPDPEATERMADLEARARGTALIQRMQIATHYSPGGRLAQESVEDPEPKTLWGVVDGDAAMSRQLWVFSGPGRMAGTSLLLHDAADPATPDAMWFFLRAFGSFSQLGAGAERTVVPGTAITYEDARGFVAVDKYHFHTVAETDAATVRILACPRSAEIARALGYGALRIDVDRAQPLMRRIDYRGPSGRLLKQYTVLESVEMGTRTLPSEIRLEQRTKGFVNEIAIEYWPPISQPAPDFFEPDVAQVSFLARLRAFLRDNGLGDRIDAEVARSRRAGGDLEAARAAAGSVSLHSSTPLSMSEAGGAGSSHRRVLSGRFAGFPEAPAGCRDRRSGSRDRHRGSSGG